MILLKNNHIGLIFQFYLLYYFQLRMRKSSTFKKMRLTLFKTLLHFELYEITHLSWHGTSFNI